MREAQQILNALPGLVAALPKVLLLIAFVVLLFFYALQIYRNFRAGKIGVTGHELFYVAATIAVLTYVKVI